MIPLLLLSKHLAILLLGQMFIFFVENNILFIETVAQFFQVVLTVVTQAQHTNRECPVRQVEQFPMHLIILHNIPDVAGADPHRLCGDDRVLCCNHRVLDGQQQVGFLRRFKLQPLAIAIFGHSIEAVVIKPALMVRQEDQDDRCSGDKSLMITGLSKDLLGLLVAHHNDRIQHLVARCWGAHHRLQNDVQRFLGNFPLVIDSQRDTVV